MRAREFITESQDWRSRYDQIDEYQGILMGTNILDWEVEVYALTRDGREMGSVIFERDGKTLVADGVIVRPEYQGQGVATDMYDYTKSLGFKIIASPDQTDDGKAFWKKHRGNQTVWEDTVDEMALPAEWDPTMLGHDKTFKSRVEYAKQRARRLGGGSSRVAFIIPDNGRDTVLKVAKNTKGMAQNEAEVDVLTDGYVGQMDIVIPLVDYDKQNPKPTWLQTELAQKAREPALCKLLKCKSLVELCGYANYIIGNDRGGFWKNMPEKLLQRGYSEQDVETFREYASELGDLVSSSGVLMGDFQQAGNWGIYKGRPVVIDVGFNQAVNDLYWGKR